MIVVCVRILENEGIIGSRHFYAHVRTFVCSKTVYASYFSQKVTIFREIFALTQSAMFQISVNWKMHNQYGKTVTRVKYHIKQYYNFIHGYCTKVLLSSYF